MENTKKRTQTAITTDITVDNESWSVSLPAGALTLKFAHGETLTLRLVDLKPELLGYSALHGLKQKLVDAAAISRNPETGRSATIDDKYEAVKAVYDRLMAGQWNAVREGGGNSGGLLYRALCRMYEGAKTPEQIAAYLESKTDAEKTALRGNPKVAAIIADIRAETGKAANINTDALLDELGD